MKFITEPPKALHAAARRYCGEQYEHWLRTYRGSKWSEAEGYGIFPRYLVLRAILSEVERIDAQEVRSLEEMRELLLRAGLASEDGMTLNLKQSVGDERALPAMEEERATFAGYVESLSAEQLSHVEPMAFRRTLPRAESDALWLEVRTRWNIRSQHWYPLSDDRVLQDVMAFHQDLFTAARNGSELLRSFLSDRGISRVFQFCEFHDVDPDCEIELSLLKPTCEFEGRYWTSKDLDWLVYASHESSVTVGGEWLVSSFRAVWPDWQDRQYGGPFSTHDLGGTWEIR